MARKLQAFTIERKIASQYPWEQWMDGGVWEVKRGEDFKATIESMKGTLYNRAKRGGYTVQMVSQGDTLQFKFTRNPPKPNGVQAVREP